MSSRAILAADAWAVFFSGSCFGRELFLSDLSAWLGESFSSGVVTAFLGWRSICGWVFLVDSGLSFLPFAFSSRLRPGAPLSSVLDCSCICLRTQLAWVSSMVLIWFLTSKPNSSRILTISLLESPISFASSCTLIFAIPPPPYDLPLHLFLRECPGLLLQTRNHLL